MCGDGELEIRPKDKTKPMVQTVTPTVACDRGDETDSEELAEDHPSDFRPVRRGGSAYTTAKFDELF